jgi:hypothetical protein
LGLCRRRQAWGGLDPPGIAYVYAPDRKAKRLFSHLAGFKGVLQVDSYNAYPKLADRGEVELAFCWVHMRRNFYELAAAGPAPIASAAGAPVPERLERNPDLRRQRRRVTTS